MRKEGQTRTSAAQIYELCTVHTKPALGEDPNAGWFKCQGSTLSLLHEFRPCTPRSDPGREGFYHIAKVGIFPAYRRTTGLGSATAAGGAAGVTLQTSAVADHGELSAFATHITLVASQPRVSDLGESLVSFGT